MSGDSKDTDLNSEKAKNINQNNSLNKSKTTEKKNYCCICKVQCTAAKNFEEHKKGRKHLKKVSEADTVKKQESGAKCKNVPSKKKCQRKAIEEPKENPRHITLRKSKVSKEENSEKSEMNKFKNLRFDYHNSERHFDRHLDHNQRRLETSDVKCQRKAIEKSKKKTQHTTLKKSKVSKEEKSEMNKFKNLRFDYHNTEHHFDHNQRLPETSDVDLTRTGRVRYFNKNQNYQNKNYANYSGYFNSNYQNPNYNNQPLYLNPPVSSYPPYWNPPPYSNAFVVNYADYKNAEMQENFLQSVYDFTSNDNYLSDLFDIQSGNSLNKPLQPLPTSCATDASNTNSPLCQTSDNVNKNSEVPEINLDISNINPNLKSKDHASSPLAHQRPSSTDPVHQITPASSSTDAVSPALCSNRGRSISVAKKIRSTLTENRSSSDKKTKDSNQNQSVSSDGTIEQQKIKDWTNSLLETNHGQISRLIHPSNYKDKAAVNHLITNLSKSKRKENLTRLKLGSNSLGSAETNDEDENIILEEVDKVVDSVTLESSDISAIPYSNEVKSVQSNSDIEQNNAGVSIAKKDKRNCLTNQIGSPVNLNSKKSHLSHAEESFVTPKTSVKRKEKVSTPNSKSTKNQQEKDTLCTKKTIKKRKSSTTPNKSKKQKCIDIGLKGINEGETTEHNLNLQLPTAENCVPDVMKVLNIDSLSDAVPVLKNEVAELFDENNAGASAATSSQNIQAETLDLNSGFSVEALIQLFATGDVKVKNEFNDPVIDAIKTVDPAELIACSHKTDEAWKKAAESAAEQSKNNPPVPKPCPLNVAEGNRSSFNPVISSVACEPSNSQSSNASLPSNSQSSNAPVPSNSQSSNAPVPSNSQSSNAPVPSNSQSSNAPVLSNDQSSNAPVPSNSQSPNSVLSFSPGNENSSLTDTSIPDDYLSCVDHMNLIPKDKSELSPHLKKLIKDLQKIASQEEVVKHNLQESKNKISEYQALLGEWKNKKKMLQEEEEDLRKERNNIIELMQKAVKPASEANSENDTDLEKVPTPKKSMSSSSETNEYDRQPAVSPVSNVNPFSSSPQEKIQKPQENTEAPPSPESDEIAILPSPVKKEKLVIVIEIDDTDDGEFTSSAGNSQGDILTNVVSSNVLSVFDVKTVTAHKTIINCLVVFENFLYTCSNDNTARRFSLKDPSQSVTYLHTAKNVTEIVVERVQNEALVFTSCTNRVSSIFIASSGTKIKSFFQACAIMSICKGWGKFYCGLADGTINVYNWKYEEREVVKSDEPASRISTTHQGRLHFLIILTSNGNISIRDAETGLLIRYIKGFVKLPSWLTVYNNLAYFTGSDKTVTILDINTGRAEKKLYLTSHSTGLAVYEDHIFTISYSGSISCYNKERVSDKKIYYGAGKTSLTCIHVFQDWVFTGNRKGEVSVFKFDPLSTIICQFGNCSSSFGLKEDVEFHVEKDHISRKKYLSKCQWGICSYLFPPNWDIQDKMRHLRKHIQQNTISFVA